MKTAGGPNCNVWGWGKGFGLVRNVTIRNSYVHDLVSFGDPANGGSHNEAVLSLGGSDFTLTGNRFDAGAYPNFSAAATLYSQFERIRNVLMEGNLLNGGGYCLYAGSDSPVVAENANLDFSCAQWNWRCLVTGDRSVRARRRLPV